MVDIIAYMVRGGVFINIGGEGGLLNGMFMFLK
jgi:hypothetical protein